MTELGTPSLIGEEMFGGSLCYRIKGKDPQGEWDELWIEKKDLLLRKVREETKYPDYVTIQEEIHQNIRINQPIAGDLFDFKPPIALTPRKESKPGSDLSDIFQDEAPTWSEFTSAEGRFSLLMPGEPHSQILTLESAQGRFEHHIFVAMRGPFVCIVNYVDLPKQSLVAGNEQALFDASRDEFLKVTEGKLSSETAISMDGHVGRELKMRIPGGAARVRVLLIDGRFYQFAIVEVSTGSSSDDATDKFLNSFKVLPTRKPTAFYEPGHDSPQAAAQLRP